MKKYMVVVTLMCIASCCAGKQVGSMSDDEYHDRVLGCWTAKCAGGALGMPLESWSYQEIEKKYPKIDGYIGYFTNDWGGWSDFLSYVKVPMDGQFHDLTTTVTIPQFDAAKRKALPIVGLSVEMGKGAAQFEVESIKVLQPVGKLSWPDSWMNATNSMLVPERRVMTLNFDGERTWIKAKNAAVEHDEFMPGDEVVLQIRAKRTTGTEERIGVAFDYYLTTLKPGFGPDDDTSYQISNLLALEKYGPGVTSEQMGKMWAETLPQISPLLAEGVALANLRKGILPPESGKKDNHSSEAIGGQMRGEIWGLVCAGRPDLAVEYAKRDAEITHWRNGVYGEQFVSAMIAESFNTTEPLKLIETGLKYIPKDCEYANTVNWMIKEWKAKRNWRDVRTELIKKYPAPCNPVYADAGIITLATLYGEGNFEKTMTIAAYCGSDTDCNVATVCALIGSGNGTCVIGKKWSDPLADQFRCFVTGHENWSINDLAKRIAAQHKAIMKYHGSGNKFKQ